MSAPLFWLIVPADSRATVLRIAGDKVTSFSAQRDDNTSLAAQQPPQVPVRPQPQQVKIIDPQIVQPPQKQPVPAAANADANIVQLNFPNEIELEVLVEYVSHHFVEMGGRPPWGCALRRTERIGRNASQSTSEARRFRKLLSW
jgi:hypothetical protein